MASAGKRCWVPNCNSSEIKDVDMNFYHLPPDVALRETWLAVAGKKLKNQKSVFFCEKHFKAGSTIEIAGQFKRLHVSAVPTLYMPKSVCKTCGVTLLMSDVFTVISRKVPTSVPIELQTSEVPLHPEPLYRILNCCVPELRLDQTMPSLICYSCCISIWQFYMLKQYCNMPNVNTTSCLCCPKISDRYFTMVETSPMGAVLKKILGRLIRPVPLKVCLKCYHLLSKLTQFYYKLVSPNKTVPWQQQTRKIIDDSSNCNVNYDIGNIDKTPRTVTVVECNEDEDVLLTVRNEGETIKSKFTYESQLTLISIMLRVAETLYPEYDLNKRVVKNLTLWFNVNRDFNRHGYCNSLESLQSVWQKLKNQAVVDRNIIGPPRYIDVLVNKFLDLTENVPKRVSDVDCEVICIDDDVEAEEQCSNGNERVVTNNVQTNSDNCDHNISPKINKSVVDKQTLPIIPPDRERMESYRPVLTNTSAIFNNIRKLRACASKKVVLLSSHTLVPKNAPITYGDVICIDDDTNVNCNTKLGNEKTANLTNNCDTSYKSKDTNVAQTQQKLDRVSVGPPGSIGNCSGSQAATAAPTSAKPDNVAVIQAMTNEFNKRKAPPESIVSSATVVTPKKQKLDTNNDKTPTTNILTDTEKMVIVQCIDQEFYSMLASCGSIDKSMPTILENLNYNNYSTETLLRTWNELVIEAASLKFTNSDLHKKVLTIVKTYGELFVKPSDTEEKVPDIDHSHQIKSDLVAVMKLFGDEVFQKKSGSSRSNFWYCVVAMCKDKGYSESKADIMRTWKYMVRSARKTLAQDRTPRPFDKEVIDLMHDVISDTSVEVESETQTSGMTEVRDSNEVEVLSYDYVSLADLLKDYQVEVLRTEKPVTVPGIIEILDSDEE